MSEIRELGPGEAKSIYELMQAAYKVEAELLQLANFNPLQRTVEAIAASENRFLGSLIGERLVAVCELEPLDEQTLLIASLVAHPEKFRQGLASSLLKHVFQQESFETLKISTAAKNFPALRLYKKLGFQQRSSQTLAEGLELISLEYQR